MSTHTILILEVRPEASRMLQRTLRADDHSLVASNSPTDALEQIESQEFAVVIAGHHPPHVQGPALLKKIRSRSPNTMRLLVTEDDSDPSIMEALYCGDAHLLVRPSWKETEVRALVRRAIEWHMLVQENEQLHTQQERQSERAHAATSRLSEEQSLLSEEDAPVEDDASIKLDFSALKPGLDYGLLVMSRLIQIHSPSLARHSKRVAGLSTKLAQRIALPPSMVQQIEAGALLHDIGKVLINHKILRKPASILTPAERAPIRQHPEWGEKLLRSIPHLDAAAQFVRHHHELFNGSGYPDELPCCQIPLGARLIAVTDAYDNLLHGRTVFRSRSPANSVKALREDAPDKYDPTLVELLACEVLTTPPDEAPPELIGLPLDALQPGMKLGQDFALNPDLLLLAEGIVLDQDDIKRLQQFSEATPTLDFVLVHENRMPQPVSGSPES